MASYVTFRQD